MDRFYDESVWLRCPDFANVFIGREPAECLEPVCEEVVSYEIGQVCAEWSLLW